MNQELLVDLPQDVSATNLRDGKVQNAWFDQQQQSMLVDWLAGNLNILEPLPCDKQHRFDDP